MVDPDEKPTPQPVRKVKVTALTAAGFAGMGKVAEGTTAAEVWSACLSMALSAVQMAKSVNADVEPFRAAIEQIWRELPPEETH